MKRALLLALALFGCSYDDAGANPDVLVTAITNIPACDTPPAAPCDGNTLFDDQVSHLNVTLGPSINSVTPNVVYQNSTVRGVQFKQVPPGIYTLHVDAVANNSCIVASAELPSVQIQPPAVLSIDFVKNGLDGGVVCGAGQ